MERLGKIIVFLLLDASPLFGQWDIGQRPHYRAGGVIMTLAQSPMAPFNTAQTTYSVSITAGGMVPTTAGNIGILLVALAAADTAATNPYTSGAVADSAGDTFTHCGSAWPQTVLNTGDSQYEVVDCFWYPSLTGGATSVTLTVNWEAHYATPYVDLQFLEASKSSGTWSFAGGATAAALPSGTSLSAAPITGLAAGNYYCTTWETSAHLKPVSIAPAWASPITIDNTNAYAAFAGVLDLSTWTTPTWTLSATEAYEQMTASACWQ